MTAQSQHYACCAAKHLYEMFSQGHFKNEPSTHTKVVSLYVYQQIFKHLSYIDIILHTLAKKTALLASPRENQ